MARDEGCRPRVGLFDVVDADPRSEAATRLMRALMVEEALVYHDMGPDPFDDFRPEEILVPGGAFVMARFRDEAIGCGALRPIDAGAGEINRMYVVPATRRHGAGRAILGELERLAVEFGYRAIRLETGNRQPEAIRFYEALGFRRIPAFGSHAGDPVSLFYEKEIGSQGLREPLA